VALGVLVGLAVTEGVFRLRDGGAFPRLNVYEPDPTLGVRLRPGATERLAFNGNPPTQVRINSQGFRGGEPPPPGANEILVVGDSQAFGLGVEESESFARRLEAELPGHEVFNAGVPTYGPPEFYEVTRRLLIARGATTVVYVVNLANDLFEAGRPNLDRHVAVDGWALRRESAAFGVTEFPGRSLIFRDSHAFFAYRAWRHHEPGDPTVASPEAGFPSEGTWRDLLGETARVDAIKTKQKVARGEIDRLLAEQVENELDHQAKADVLAAQSRRAFEANAALDGVMRSLEGEEYTRTKGHPEDVVIPDYRPGAEAARPLRQTSSRLIKGAEIRQRVEAALRASASEQLRLEEAKLAAASPSDRAAAQKKIDDLTAIVQAMVLGLSPMREPLARELALCKEHGARLLVMVLPLDVQVSDGEWAKYGEAPTDMRATLTLIDDVVAVGADLGVPVWSALDALRAAEPGAFLDGDIHMTPKGHAAVARAFGAFVRDAEAVTAREQKPSAKSGH
jgi:hypothetical protein